MEGRVARGKDVGEEDLSKPFKEKLKTPLTRRILESQTGPEYVMPANIIAVLMGPLTPADHLIVFDSSETQENGPCRFGVGCFSKHWTEEPGAGSRVPPLNNINEWYQLREAFTTKILQ
ncbi:hypothetical protein Tco_1419193 [Tanacetum coccineum]